MNAKNTSDRMARPLDRAPPTAIERVPVIPPPELVIKCPHCGAARLKGWRVLGGRPNGGHTKQCLGCGLVYEMSADGRTMRLVR
jgi:hypothetical protein